MEDSKKAYWIDLLLKSLDDDLPPATQSELAEALLAFDWLAQEREAMLQMRQQLSELRFAPKSSFEVDLSQTAVTNRAKLSLIRLWPAVAASVLLVLSTAFFVIQQSSDELDTVAIIGLEGLNADDVDYYDGIIAINE